MTAIARARIEAATRQGRLFAETPNTEKLDIDPATALN